MAAKKKSKTSLAQKSPSPEYQLAVSMLESDPKTEYKAVREAGERRGLMVYPIVYGRAQAVLGIVKSAKRGEGKAKRAAAKAGGGAGGPRAAAKTSAAASQPSAQGVVRRGPGRPRKVAASVPLNGLDSIISRIRETERERDRAMETLHKIRDLIDRTL